MQRNIWVHAGRIAPLIGVGALLLQVLFAVNLTESRYVTSSGGTASVRVASVSVQASDPVLLSADELIDCNLENDTVQYEMTLTNASEVDMNYTISASSGSENIRAEVTPDQGRLPFLGGSETITITLSVIDPDSRTQTETPDPIEIIVHAVQEGEGS